ncbi:MAG: hypothetical protein A2Z20_10960 [Bdellovibrionales bacterium RBG_16_40_8]|nr:MAG: hypothetical protein A2Z20_10960 [Bdellovibrionales bacterium RBG_16_40_8]
MKPTHFPITLIATCALAICATTPELALAAQKYLNCDITTIGGASSGLSNNVSILGQSQRLLKESGSRLNSAKISASDGTMSYSVEYLAFGNGTGHFMAQINNLSTHMSASLNGIVMIEGEYGITSIDLYPKHEGTPGRHGLAALSCSVRPYSVFSIN